MLVKYFSLHEISGNSRCGIKIIKILNISVETSTAYFRDMKNYINNYVYVTRIGGRLTINLVIQNQEISIAANK